MIEITEYIVQKLGAYPIVEKIYLFGSRARGDHEARSDVDIAVVCPQATPLEWLRLCDTVDELETLLEIDLVNYDEASAELKQKIDQEGKLIYESRSRESIMKEN